jgi:hypothetical protein
MYYPLKENSMTLEIFLQTHSTTPLILAQGLGFIGSVMSLVVANAVNGNYMVAGVD